jgi:hypothetical protein
MQLRLPERPVQMLLILYKSALGMERVKAVDGPGECTLLITEEFTFNQASPGPLLSVERLSDSRPAAA